MRGFKHLLALGLCLAPSLALGQATSWPPPAGAIAFLCVYNLIPPVMTDGQVGFVQCDANGQLKGVGGGGGGGGGSVTQGSSPWIVAGTGTAGTPSVGILTVQGHASGTPQPVSQGTSPWVVSGTVAVTQTTSPWVISGTVTANTTVTPSSSSAIGITPVVSTITESTHVLKSTPGNVYSAYAVNHTATQGYLVLLNATVAPADGAILPLACAFLPPNGTASLNYAPGPPGVFSVGITAVTTSAATCFTKTTGAITAFISGLVQ